MKIAAYSKPFGQSCAALRRALYFDGIILIFYVENIVFYLFGDIIAYYVQQCWLSVVIFFLCSGPGGIFAKIICIFLQFLFYLRQISRNSALFQTAQNGYRVLKLRCDAIRRYLHDPKKKAATFLWRLRELFMTGIIFPLFFWMRRASA